MFSQYSWWDFIKFVLALVIPYYAYVLWTYYWEDIREWISNRSQSESTPVTQQAEVDDEELEHSMFTVNDYSNDDRSGSVVNRPKPATQAAEWLPTPATATPAPVAQPYQEPEYEELELQGAAVEEQPERFALPVGMEAENPQEQSIDELRSAAERITTDEQGRVSPIDTDDKPAARIAEIINQQQGHPLADFAFTR